VIAGTGFDIVEINRIQQIYDKFKDAFAERILCKVELEEYAKTNFPVRFLAKRFAAKEAVVKALGTGFSNGISPGMICIDHDEAGKPVIILLEKAKSRADEIGVDVSWISISDEKSYAAAFVIMERT
jgi:holo-[acyl-carrier protein] synthase